MKSLASRSPNNSGLKEKGRNPNHPHERKVNCITSTWRLLAAKKVAGQSRYERPLGERTGSNVSQWSMIEYHENIMNQGISEETSTRFEGRGNPRLISAKVVDHIPIQCNLWLNSHKVVNLLLTQSKLDINKRKRHQAQSLEKPEHQPRAGSKNWQPNNLYCREGKRTMARCEGRITCDDEFSRVHRDMECTLRTIRNVNKKLKDHKGEWGAWATQAETRTVQEWYSQSLINKQLKKDNKDPKGIVEAQGHQITHLHHLVNEMFMNRGFQILQESNKLPAPESSGQASQTGAGFRPYKGKS